MEHGGGPCRGRLCAPSLRGIDGRKSASDGETAKGTAEAGPFLRHVFLSYPLNIPFRAQQLGQQDRAAGGAIPVQKHCGRPDVYSIDDIFRNQVTE